MATFGEILKRLRVEAGLVQEDLAVKSGLRVGTIRVMEQDQNNPSLMSMYLLARALGGKIDIFVEAVPVGLPEEVPVFASRPKRVKPVRTERRPRGRPKKA